MEVYHAIIKSFLDKDTYTKYKEAFDFDTLRESSPDLYRMGHTLRALHEGTEGSVSLGDLKLTYQTLYPQTQEATLGPLFNAIRDTDIQHGVVVQYLQAAKQRHTALQVAQVALAVAEGRSNPSVLKELLETTKVEAPNGTIEDANDFLDDDLSKLHQSTQTPGLRWRLNSLNRALGSLRKGDFGFVFARPETGKTTFLSSEVTFMASQTERPILWFNNEEQSDKVLLRCYQAALGKQAHEIFADTNRNRELYLDKCKGNIRFPAFELCNKRSIESICAKQQPSLVIFDQITKLKGFSGDRDDLELSAICNWARELAKSYCPIIGITQAGQSAEGKRWLTMNDVMNSKTGMQAEADFILGIGKSMDESLSYERYLHLSKNKLLGDSDSQEAWRHGKWAVRIEPEIARYSDVD